MKISEKAAASAPKFETAKRLTWPLSKWVNGETKYVKFTAPIYKGKEVKGKQEGKVMEPADLAVVIDLVTGEEVQIIVAAVLNGILREHYPEAAYVGRGFAITQHRDTAKRYNTYDVQEIVVPAGM